jgi:hypothetical protein
MTLRPDAHMVLQDHRDDLESFFYFLLWICSLFVAPRKLINKAILRKLEAPEDGTCADFKCSLLIGVRRLMSPWFIDTVFMDLLRTLGKILDGWVRIKIEALDDISPTFPSIKRIRADVGTSDHDLFLQKIDAAIESLLSDQSDFGHSKGANLRGQETVDLDDDAISAPVLDNQASVSYGNVADNKRGRSPERDNESEDYTKKAHLEDDSPSTVISHLQITNTGSSADEA